MDPVIESVIISYAKVIVTVLLIVFAVMLAYKSLKYIRGFFKHGNLMRRLRRVCRDNGYRLTVNANTRLSVFFPTKTPEIIVETPGKTYHVKLIAFVNPARTYILNGENRIFIDDHVTIQLLRYRGRLKNPTGLAPKILNHIAGNRNFVGIDNGGTIRELTRPDHHVNFPHASDISANILCIHPTSHEMLRVEGSRMVTIFDGDILGSCTVYSGSALLKLLDALPGSSPIAAVRG